MLHSYLKYALTLFIACSNYLRNRAIKVIRARKVSSTGVINDMKSWFQTM